MRWNTWLVSGYLLTCLLAVGCATTGGERVEEAAPTTDGVTVVETRPASPAVMAHEERFVVDVEYELATAEKGILLVRPYTGGRQTRSYKAHPPLPVTKGRGTVTGFFSFAVDSKVDEVRVTLVDPLSKVLLASQTSMVQVVWAEVGAP